MSLYNRPGKGLMAVVANLGREPQTAAVRFDLARLKQSGSLRAWDVANDRELPAWSGGALTVTLASLDHVVVWLRPGK